MTGAQTANRVKQFLERERALLSERLSAVEALNAQFGAGQMPLEQAGQVLHEWHGRLELPALFTITTGSLPPALLLITRSCFESWRPCWKMMGNPIYHLPYLGPMNHGPDDGMA